MPDQKIEPINTILGYRIPTTLIDFWRERNWSGLSGDHFEIYSLDEIVERNQTFETQEYCPGYLAIGNDAGSKVALMAGRDDANEIFINYASSMKPSSMVSSGYSIGEWVNRGCPFDTDEGSGSRYSAIKKVNLVLASVPGLKELMKIRSTLGLTVGVSELKQLPCGAVLASLSYIGAIYALEKLGMGGVVEIRDPTTKEVLSSQVKSWRTD